MNFWRSEFSQEEIEYVLDQIRPHRTFTSTGGVSISGVGNLDHWTAFLVSSMELETRTDAIKTGIVRGTLFSKSLKLDFTEKDFRAAAYRLRAEFEHKNQKKYLVVFPIWNRPVFLKGLLRIDDVTVNFSPSPRSRKFKVLAEERDKQRSNRHFKFHFTKERLIDLDKCSICIASVAASSPSDANERACQAIYEILGTANMSIDYSKYWRSSSRVEGKYPVSEVLVGPHTTTHTVDGKLTHDGFWHENWVGGPSQGALNEKQINAWEKRYRRLSSAITISRWKKLCKLAAARYYRAFSNPNLQEAFLEGWRLFENITGPRFEKAEVKINRVSNVFENNIEKRILGKHMAMRRNLISHGHAIKSEDDETLAFQMLQFVLPYVERFILNGFKFKKIEEFWDFLDIPASEKIRSDERLSIRRRLALLDTADKFRSK